MSDSEASLKVRQASNRVKTKWQVYTVCNGQKYMYPTSRRSVSQLHELILHETHSTCSCEIASTYYESDAHNLQCVSPVCLCFSVCGCVVSFFFVKLNNSVSHFGEKKNTFFLCK